MARLFLQDSWGPMQGLALHAHHLHLFGGLNVHFSRKWFSRNDGSNSADTWGSVALKTFLKIYFVTCLSISKIFIKFCKNSPGKILGKKSLRKKKKVASCFFPCIDGQYGLWEVTRA